MATITREDGNNYNQGYFGSVGRFVAEVSQWGSSALAAIREIGCLWDCCSRTPTDADNPRARLITENVGGNNSDATPSVAPNANNPIPPLIPVNQLNVPNENRAECLDILQSIPEDERTEFVQLVNQLDVHGHGLDCYLQLQPVPGHERAEFVRLANLVKVPNEGRCCCLFSLRFVRSDKRLEFVHLANLLDVPNEDRWRCLSTLESIPEHERAGFVGSANQLNVPNEHRRDCLGILQGIHKDQRDGFVGSANQLNVPNEHRRDCLGILQGIHKDQRDDFVQLANQLNVPNEHRRDCLGILQDIPENERDDFVQLANQLNVPNEHRRDCLGILQDIPENERDDFVQLANQLNVPNEHRRDHLRVLQNSTPENERNAYIFEESLGRHPASTADEDIPLFDAINDFDLNDNIVEHPAFKVTSTSIPQDPVATLSLLAEKMQNSGSPLKIKYEDSVAVDNGGISRDFVTKLLDALFKPGTFPTTDPDNGLIIPKFSGKIPEKCYQGLGLIFADALNQEICTGCRFHPTLFQMLHSLTNEEIDKVNTEHQQDPYNKILKIYLQSQHQYSSINENDLDAFVNNGTVPPHLELGGIDSKEDFLKDTGIHEMIMSTLMIAQHTKQRLTLRNQSWDAVKGNTPNDLREKIEGRLTKDDILNALQNDESNQFVAVSNQKGWLEHWIRASTPEQLENFMYAISGSKALPLGKTLRITDDSDLSHLPVFHTCSYEVNIPRYQDYNTFKDKFEKSLEHATQGVMQVL